MGIRGAVLLFFLQFFGLGQKDRTIHHQVISSIITSLFHFDIGKRMDVRVTLVGGVGSSLLPGITLIFGPDTLGVDLNETRERASQPPFFIAFLISFLIGCESFSVSIKKIWYNQLRDQKQKKQAQEYM